MTAARVVVVNAGVPAVPRKLAQAFAEDAVAIASWAEAVRAARGSVVAVAAGGAASRRGATARRRGVGGAGRTW